MIRPEQIVTLTIEQQRYGIPLGMVERVVRMVEITILPAGAEFLAGVINLQGEILPVVDLRHRFGLPPRQVELSDQLIIINSSKRKFALTSEAPCEVMECGEKMFSNHPTFLPDLPFTDALAKMPDGLVLLSGLDALLYTHETETMDEFIGNIMP